MSSARRVALVLGAGGAFGWAWHLGVLEAVEHELGVHAADAHRLVGTSAGAAMAIAASSGVGTERILEVITERPDEATVARVQELRAEMRRPWRWLRPMAPRLIVDPGPHVGLRSMVGLLPAGLIPTSPLRRFPAPQDWPENLIVTAVSLADGSRTAWAGTSPIDVHDALEASAAVPMLFEPKSIDGVRYIDGAIASATNADLVVDHVHGPPDIVVISSPMTRPGSRFAGPRARRQLDDEVSALERSGSRVVVVEPDAATVALAEGYPRTNHDAGPKLVASARRLALAQF